MQLNLSEWFSELPEYSKINEEKPRKDCVHVPHLQKHKYYANLNAGEGVK